MADWYGSARSNYFRVKDREEFVKWALAMNLEVIEDKEGRVGLLADSDPGSWPSYRYDQETDEEEEVDLFGELSEHLVEGSVAVFLEVGAEKLRYLTGWAVAVNSSGTEIRFSLDEIYDRAKALGDEITDASY